MKSEEILKIASKLVSGDRAKAYGDKKKLHDKTAKMWSAFLGYTIHAEQVAHMMVMLKIARTTTGNNPDNYVDAAAYSAIAGEINDHNKNK
tara:strand:+ start:296 stop:568 length:273 start_codon:yes stop_codon:yes gene_type:complete